MDVEQGVFDTRLGARHVERSSALAGTALAAAGGGPAARQSLASVS